jgi:cytosine/adenosine deaminase-related metal-dependent hydrolase
VRTLIRGARVLTLDSEDREFDEADILIDGSVIAEVGRDLRVAPGSDLRRIEGRGQLAMPGLVNGHFHSSVNHMKGSLDSLPLEVFMLYESPSDGAADTPRAAYVRTMLGALEMLKTGVTAVLDDAFFTPAPDPDVIDAVMQAYADSGIRATLALDQPNVPEVDKLPFLADLLPPDLLARAQAPAPMDSAGLLGCYRHLIERWHGAAGGRLRAAVSCSAPQRVTPDYFAALDDLSRADNLPFYAHVLETKLQRVLGEEKFGGRSLVRGLFDQGFLSDRLNIIHGVWLDDADMDLIAAAGAVIAHNPISNLRLGSGIMPFAKLRARGIPICLGTDEAIADDAVNMWSVAKMAGLIHNVSTSDYLDWPTAAQVLECLVGGGARALRSPVPIGAIAPGHQADLVLLDLDALPFIPLNDVRRQLVYCETGSSVRLTMVAGEVVAQDGKVLSVDEAALLAEMREIAERQRTDSRSARSAAGTWLPYYRRMYLKAVGRDVGLYRRLPDA